MPRANGQPSHHETQEGSFSVNEVYRQFESIGQQLEERWSADYPDQDNLMFDRDRLTAVFHLGIAATRARLIWIRQPELQQANGDITNAWLENGSLEIRKGAFETSRKQLFILRREIEGDQAKPIIKFFDEADLEQLARAPRNHTPIHEALSDQAPELSDFHDALRKIEEDLADPEQTIDWHADPRRPNLPW